MRGLSSNVSASACMCFDSRNLLVLHELLLMVTSQIILQATNIYIYCCANKLCLHIYDTRGGVSWGYGYILDVVDVFSESDLFCCSNTNLQLVVLMSCWWELSHTIISMLVSSCKKDDTSYHLPIPFCWTGRFCCLFLLLFSFAPTRKALMIK